MARRAEKPRPRAPRIAAPVVAPAPPRVRVVAGDPEPPEVRIKIARVLARLLEPPRR